LTLELLFKVGPGSSRKDTSVRLLAKEVLRLSCSSFLFEKGEGLEDFFLVTAELLQDQVQIEGTGVEEGPTGTLFTGEV